MKLVKTAKIKLDLLASDVLPTIQAYTKAFNFVCSTGFPNKNKNRISLHKLTYEKIRGYLPSQLAISSISKATEALASVLKKTKHKKYGSCPNSKSCSIRYDKNSYSFSVEKSRISLLTISGRKKFKLNIPEYYKEQFVSWKHKSADLIVRNKKVYLHISFEKEVTSATSTKTFIGIDRGINNIAVTSNNKFFGGKIIKEKILQYRSLRSKLQSKGTQSAKRHLSSLAGKEQRFRADANHKISKDIIKSLNAGDTIVLEDLKGIRSSKLRKAQRILLHNWSFFQLEQFITYKALGKGINVIRVNAAYTSQECSKCGHTCKENRKSQSDFRCVSCGFKLNADLNASRNISAKGSKLL